MRALATTLAGLAFAATATAASAQVATQTGQHNAWGSYNYRTDSGPVCYIASVPSAFNPSEGVNHGDIFFLVTRKPNQNVQLEPSFRAMGYEFAQGSQIRVTIGDRTFNMDPSGGSAWIGNAAEETQLVEAMKSGSEMRVAARSSRPRDVSYTFSLRGVTAALNSINDCR